MWGVAAQTVLLEAEPVEFELVGGREARHDAAGARCGLAAADAPDTDQGEPSKVYSGPLVHLDMSPVVRDRPALEYGNPGKIRGKRTELKEIPERAQLVFGD